MLLRVAGVLVIFVVLQDLFFTVLYPASERGPVRKPLADFIWQGFRGLGRHLSSQRRRNLLSYCGPFLITATLVVWLGLLWLGWTLIYKPALGTGIQASSGSTDTSWSTAFYYSGFNLTTLGVGDVVPKTGLYRLLAVVQAAMGFASISMVVTYFLSVYSNLTQRNAFVQGLHHYTNCTDEADVLIARWASGGELSSLASQLDTMASHFRTIYQNLHFYPVLRYFHYRERCYELAVALETSLDTLALLHSVLDPREYQAVDQAPAAEALMQASLALLRELQPKHSPRGDFASDVDRERETYRRARARLQEAGLKVHPDPLEGSAAYVRHRAQWAPLLNRLKADTLVD